MSERTYADGRKIPGDGELIRQNKSYRLRIRQLKAMVTLLTIVNDADAADRVIGEDGSIMWAAVVREFEELLAQNPAIEGPWKLGRLAVELFTTEEIGQKPDSPRQSSFIAPGGSGHIVGTIDRVSPNFNALES